MALTVVILEAMAEKDDLRTELQEVRAALEALSGRKDDATYAALIQSLEDKQSSLEARLTGDGALAQGAGAVAAGREGVAIGRVDGEVHIHHGSSPDEDENFGRRRYLSRVFEETGHLPLSGVDPAMAHKAANKSANTRLRLQSVYTALLTLGVDQDAMDPQTGRHPAALRQAEGEKERLSALDQLDRHPRLVLLGDPGSGKSTFVNFVALCLAGQALGRDDANLERLRAPLPEDDGSDAEEGQSWRREDLLPVRVVLRDFAAQETAPSLWGFLKQTLVAGELEEFVPELRRELSRGSALVLLDGLDEVPEAESRRQAICQAVEEFRKQFPQVRLLVTSRTYAYQHQRWRLPGFEVATLAPFSGGQVRRFVRRWYEHAAPLLSLSAEEAAGRAHLLERAIFASDRLHFLAERPLLLTLMASLHSWRGGTLPEHRERLYADTVELLLEFWEQRRVKPGRDGQAPLVEPSLAEWLEVDREKVRGALEELAFEVHGAQETLEGTADLPEERLVSRLLRLRSCPTENSVILVDFLSQRAGLLESRGVGVYTFPHRTFQEYLAACHLTEAHLYPRKVAELARTDPGRWREAALLAGAKAARGTPAALWSLIDALCFRSPEEASGSEADAWGALLASQALVESGSLEELAEYHEPKVDHLRGWLVHLLGSELPAVERALAGRCLARLGDPRFDEDLWGLPADPLLGFCEIPEGPFLMGSDPEVDGQAYEDEQPQHRLNLPTYSLSRFPVTVGQFRAFVASSGHEPTDARSVEGASNQPVVWVTWFEALAYCRWLDEQLKRRAEEELGRSGSSASPLWKALVSGALRVGLPSEAEWEKAARGTEGAIYPWGPKAEGEKANYQATGVGERTSVGCFPSGVSPFGCEEMSGNVWEWTRSAWGDNLFEASFSYPYEANDRREDLHNRQFLRVLRGGSFDGSHRIVRCAVRHWGVPEDRGSSLGFRVGLFPFSLDSGFSGL